MSDQDEIKTPYYTGDEQETILAVESQINDSSKEGLKSLLELLRIKKVIYVDDEHSPGIDFEIVRVTLDEIIANDKLAELKQINIEGLDLDLPFEEIASSYKTTWEQLTLEKKKTILQHFLSINGDEGYQFDITRAERISNLFPDGLMSSIDPLEWDNIKDTINHGLHRLDKILVLFDQDLRGAGGRFTVTKGENLIVEVRTKSFRNQIICTLLTHLIPQTGGELAYRQTILDQYRGQLRKSDFFALTKLRIDNNALLSDGIKKVLLNKFCEFIKDNSTRIIRSSYWKVLEKIKNMDTYDFDHIVLRSSYTEGIWEAETLFRISKNLYDHEIKKQMVEKKYAEKVNKQIKQAKAISDFRFKIDSGIEPYAEKYKLRNQDIYEPGNIINSLNLPLENGDVFEVTSGKAKGKYILVAQECDLMMRTNPIGVRSAKLATLLPIVVYDRNSLDKEVVAHFSKFAEKNHYLSSKFPLEYFNYGTTDIGIVNFNSAIVIELDALDLVVFNTDGEAKLNISNTFDVNLLSSSWENRYLKLLKKFKDEALLQKSLLGELSKVHGSFRDKFKNKIYMKLSPVKEIGLSATFDGDSKFLFGIKRTMRLKPQGSKYLLDRYYKHLSRTAEQHDFAD